MPRPPTKAKHIADALAGQIAGGQPAETSWLPSERELSQRFRADRSTVRRALKMLVEQGLVELDPGTGARVLSEDERRLRRNAADVTSRVDQWRGFHVSVLQGGRTPYTQTEVRHVALAPEPARWLGLPAGTRVLERARVQGVDEEPIQLSTTWVAPEVAERLPILRQVDTGPGGMLSRMEEVGHRLRFEDTVTCRLPLDNEQAALRIGPHDPVLVVWRRCYDQTDRIVEATLRVIAGHKHELIYRYDRS